MPGAEGAWRLAGAAAEPARELAGVGEAAGGRHRPHRGGLLRQQDAGVVELAPLPVLAREQAEAPAEGLAEGLAADALAGEEGGQRAGVGIGALAGEADEARHCVVAAAGAVGAERLGDEVEGEGGGAQLVRRSEQGEVEQLAPARRQVRRIGGGEARAPGAGESVDQPVGERTVEQQPALAEEAAGVGIEAVPLAGAEQQQRAGCETAALAVRAPRAGAGMEEEEAVRVETASARGELRPVLARDVPDREQTQPGQRRRRGEGGADVAGEARGAVQCAPRAGT